MLSDLEEACLLHGQLCELGTAETHEEFADAESSEFLHEPAQSEISRRICCDEAADGFIIPQVLL